MEKRRYKAILNLGYKNESVIYFDKLTQKKVHELLNDYNNYVLLYYEKYLQAYVVFDRSLKIKEYQVALFNNNIREYCERY